MLTCVDFDEEGWCYTGGENGMIQIWGNENVVSRFIKVHTGSQVTAIHVEGKKLISASKDNKLAIMSIAAGATIKFEKLIDLATVTVSQNLPLAFAKSIDCFNDNLLVGLRNGTIVEIKNGE